METTAMYRLLTILVCLLFIYPAAEAKITSNANSLLLINPISSNTEMSEVQKPSLRERLLKKIFERKLRKADEEKTKRLVNKLGIISLVSGIAAPVILLPLYAIASYGLVQVLFILALLLMITAVVTGIISLLKRKKLADKKGTHTLPAILGIVFGGGLLLLIVLIAATLRFNY
jgi:VIT1/CCC1 family predicted Fe2+/Mn2+ transporter